MSISITDLNNAQLDVGTLAQIATSLSPTIVDRFGQTHLTAAGALARMTGMTVRGPWVSGTAYAINDLVQSGGTWYVCIAAHTAGSTFASDLATKWRPATASPAVQKTLADPAYAVVGDGAADDTAGVNAALAANLSTYVSDGVQALVTTLTNPLGHELAGPGSIVKSITGGNQRLNLTADRGQHVFGQEYLYAFHTAIVAQFGGASANVVMSGDSTTYGTGGNGASAPFLISDLVTILGGEAGFKLNVINRGQPGADTYQWRVNYLAGDLAASPKLLVLRWGINDPGWLKDNTTPPLDAGQTYPNRRDIGDYANDLRQGLATIRATSGCGVDNLSILLMTPNSTADTPNGRDELWYEQVRLVVRQAARDFKCAFIDTYSIWPDSRAAAGLWQDNLLPGRAIHPHNVMNAWIGAKIAELLFPPGLRYSMLPSAYGLQGAANPFDFKIGLNLETTDPAGYPGSITGGLLTIRGPDDAAMQVAWDTATTTKMPAIRFGGGATWGPWLSRPAVDIALTGGWAANASGQEVRASMSGKMVTLSGTIKSGATTTGTVIATLPAGFRPIGTQWFKTTCSADFTGSAVVQVTSDGNVRIQNCASNGALSLSGITFEAFN